MQSPEENILQLSLTLSQKRNKNLGLDNASFVGNQYKIGFKTLQSQALAVLC